MSVGEGCCGNGWARESPASGCNSVQCSSGMVHTSPGVSKCPCHCLHMVTSRICALCFAVLYSRGGAPLVADWKRSGSHFTCTTKGVFKQGILAAGELNGVQMQHSKLEHVSSDPRVRLCFSGSRVYLLGLPNSPDPVPQGIPSALSAEYLYCGREGTLPVFDGKLSCR